MALFSNRLPEWRLHEGAGVKIMTSALFVHLLVLIAGLFCCDLATAQQPTKPANEQGFVSLFDGQSLSGWKLAEENPDTWKVIDGPACC